MAWPPSRQLGSEQGTVKRAGAVGTTTTRTYEASPILTSPRRKDSVSRNVFRCGTCSASRGAASSMRRRSRMRSAASLFRRYIGTLSRVSHHCAARNVSTTRAIRSRGKYQVHRIWNGWPIRMETSGSRGLGAESELPKKPGCAPSHAV